MITQMHPPISKNDIFKFSTLLETFSMVEKNEPFQTRLAQVIAWTKLNQKDFAETIGIPVMRLSRALNKSKSLNTDLLQKISNKFPSINTDWIVTGRGSMQRFTANTSDTPTNSIPITRVPVHSFKQYVEAVDDPQMLAELPAVYSQDIAAASSRDFEVMDDAMSGDDTIGFMRGDFIRGQYLESKFWLQPALRGKICVVVTTDNILIRAVKQINTDSNSLTLAPLNRLYDETIIPIQSIQQIWLYKSFISDREFRLKL
jgi:hypothetical protein